MRNRAWSRANVTINQVWHARRYPEEFWNVDQCHHADEQIVLEKLDHHGQLVDGAERKTVGTGELRKYWERVT